MARIALKELPDLARAIINYDGEDTQRRREITRDALLFTFSLGPAPAKRVSQSGTNSRTSMDYRRCGACRPSA